MVYYAVCKVCCENFPGNGPIRNKSFRLARSIILIPDIIPFPFTKYLTPSILSSIISVNLNVDAEGINLYYITNDNIDELYLDMKKNGIRVE